MNLFFTQLFESETSTYTYLLADPKSAEAVIIDSVYETSARDLKLIEEHGFHLKYILDTHVHADHITGAGQLRKLTKAKTAISMDSGVDCADILLRDGDELKFGSFVIKAIATPGHTDSCMSFYCSGLLFTGDSLMIRSAGRTDFQQGSAKKLFQSIHKLYQLGDETRVFPGHDYKGFTSSCIGDEKKFNSRISSTTSEPEFITTMDSLKLSEPKKIHVSVPANLRCGDVAN